MCSNKKTGKTGHAQRKWVISELFKYCNTICTCLHGHMLSFTRFWRVYIFRLYVYVCLYRIATIRNPFRNPFPSLKASSIE